MADKKISELTALTGANVATDDQLVIVDTSAALTKNITIDEFKNALDTATGFVRITGDTMTGDLALSGADITFGDNDKAIFGAGSDLQIYHTGTYSLIADTSGTGPLRVVTNQFQLNNAADTANLFKAVEGDAVTAYYNGSPKLATTSTGIDVTGTVTADGLTVDDGDILLDSSTQAFLKLDRGTAASHYALTRYYTGGTEEWRTGTYNDASSNFYVGTPSGKYLSLTSGGDISFYEDTGTTAKFFWDASAERLGIGTSSPSGLAHVYNGMLQVGSKTGDTSIQQNTNAIRISAVPNSTTEWGGLQWYREFSDVIGAEIIASRPSSAETDTDLIFKTSTNSSNAVEAMRIDNSGNVGIGTNSPDEKLEVYQGNIKLGTDTNTTSKLIFERSAANRAEIYVGSFNQLQFDLGGSEAMRIDSSGNLLVSHTGSVYNNINTTSTIGSSLTVNGEIFACSDQSSGVMILNRKTTGDGDILGFRKNGATVGSIASKDGDIAIGTGGVGLRFGQNNSDQLTPHSMTTNSGKDAAVILGSAGARFKDLYLSGGVYLGGTDAANKLDDYEEGTWTPLITGSASNPSSTANASNLGFYTKIGRQVTVCFRVDYSSVSGGSGNFEISGLPFTSNSNSYFRSSGNISFFRGVTHGGNRLAPHALANDTKFIFYKLANASEFDDVILTSALSSSITIHGFYTYFTD